MRGLNGREEINAQKARIIHYYKNTKEKLLQIKAAYRTKHSGTSLMHFGTLGTLTFIGTSKWKWLGRN